MSRTNYIFVDFENVQETDWERIAGKPVKVVLLLGAQQKSLPFTFVTFLHQSPQQVEIIKTTKTGKNALDFVLSMRLGEIRRTDPDGDFHIISKDAGFDALVEHLKHTGSSASRHTSLAGLFPCPATELQLAQLQTRLRANANNRPKRLKSLKGYIQSALGSSATDAKVNDAIQHLVQHKALAVLSSGEVKYAA